MLPIHERIISKINKELKFMKLKSTCDPNPWNKDKWVINTKNWPLYNNVPIKVYNQEYDYAIKWFKKERKAITKELQSYAEENFNMIFKNLDNFYVGTLSTSDSLENLKRASDDENE